MISKAEAIRIRKIIVASIATSADVDDKTASTVPTLLPGYTNDGSLLRAGTRINWNGTVKKATVDIWQTEKNDPDHSPELYKTLYYKDGYRYIPTVISVTEAFDDGERGWWTDGLLYESTIPANVYTPEAYPSGWKLVEMEG